jgi:hypothetical protein
LVPAETSHYPPGRENIWRKACGIHTGCIALAGTAAPRLRGVAVAPKLKMLKIRPRAAFRRGSRAVNPYPPWG